MPSHRDSIKRRSLSPVYRRQSSSLRHRSPSPFSSESSRGRSLSREASRREKKEAKLRKKKEKHERKKHTSLNDRWGKYGIIRIADKFSKLNEFEEWLLEVKNQPRAELSTIQENDVFAEFMEDYNTATLPHKKYYDLSAWEQKKAKKIAKKQLGKKPKEVAGLRDEEAIRIERLHKQEQKLQEAEHLRVQALMQNLRKVHGTQEFEDAQNRIRAQK